MRLYVKNINVFCYIVFKLARSQSSFTDLCVSFNQVHMRFHFLTVFISAIIPFGVNAQHTKMDSHSEYHYELGLSHFNRGEYAQAEAALEQYLEEVRHMRSPACLSCPKKALIHIAESRLYRNDPSATSLLEQTVAQLRPDPLVDRAYLNIANYYYNSGKYEDAIHYFAKIDMSSLEKPQQVEINFKKAYALFAGKKFEAARSAFAASASPEEAYYYPTMYYYGLSNYYLKDYHEAITSFEKIQPSEKYGKFAPYYISKIYAEQGQDEKLIIYASGHLQQPDLYHHNDIHLLLGQAYYKQSRYDKAATHLSIYEKNSQLLTATEFYQLGYANYRAGNYEEAARAFKFIRNEQSETGQLALYYMGASLIQLDDNQTARTAFQQAAGMYFNDQVRMESVFSYGQLSLALHYPTEAIRALKSIPKANKHYAQAQRLLGEVLVKSRNYDEALGILTEIKDQSIALQEAYQKVNYHKGIERFNAGDYPQADKYLTESLEYNSDPETRIMAIFWKAEIAHIAENYELSNRFHQQFLTLTRGNTSIDIVAHRVKAEYTMGYNYLKGGHFGEALGFFQNIIATIKSQQFNWEGDFLINQVMPDAVIRAGDCLFKKNDYTASLSYYNEAIRNQYPGYVYASYQKALIEGLQDKLTQKIITLEQLVKSHRHHELADDAYFQIGITYFQLKNFPESMEAFKELIENYESHSHLVNAAYLKLGLLSYNQGDVYQALRHYKSIFKNNPTKQESQEAILAIEEIYLRDLNQPDEYFSFLESIPGFKLDNATRDSIQFSSANAKYELAEYALAVPALSEYIIKNPNGLYRIPALFNRGDAYTFMREYDKALEDFERIVSLGPSKYYEKAAKNSAIIYQDYKNDYDQSLKYYQVYYEASSTDESRLEAIIGIMQSSYRAGKNDLVLKYAEQVVAYPRVSPQEQALAHYYLGKMAFDRRDFNESVKQLNQVTRKSDNVLTAEARYLIAYIYFINKETELAQKLCQQAIKESGAYPYWVAKCLLLNAEIKIEVGDLFDARASTEAVLENYKNNDDGIKEEAQLILNRIVKKEQIEDRIKDN
jgi:tetratricopeptide (TPR) repeat protein